MDLISNRRAKDTKARYICTVLLAGYCLLAVFTSLPLKTTNPSALAVQEIASVVTSIAAKPTIVPLLSPTENNTTPQKIEVLSAPVVVAKISVRERWQLHQTTNMSDRLVLHQSSDLPNSSDIAKTLNQTRIAHLQSRPMQPSTVLSPSTNMAIANSVKPETVELEIPVKTKIFVEPASQRTMKQTVKVVLKSPAEKPGDSYDVTPVKAVHKPIQATKPIELLARAGITAKPVVNIEPISAPEPAKIDPKPVITTKTERSTTTTLASLSPLVKLPPSGLRSPLSSPLQGALSSDKSQSDFEDLVPKPLYSSFESIQKPAPVAASPAHCVANKIAGWSGTKLLPRHVEILKEKSPPSSEISLALAARLSLKGFTPGASVFMRIFKDKSELEVWLKKGERYALYHTYKICRWSGSFGPKLYEGDKQSPEGFYTVNRQLFTRPSWKWKGSFSLGYPNAYDKLHGRTGSLILVHGGCTSSGCFAMTDPVISEVHELARLARDNGQKKFNVHVYPFKLTTANLEQHQDSPWMPFWNNLKQGYDLFAKTGLPARVRVCDKRYVFAKGGVERSDDGWSGKGCYGLADYVPSWKPASRSASKGTARKSRRSAKRRRGCNLKRASCRKFASLKRKRTSSRRRKATRKKRRSSKKRLASKRRATMRRARAIGRKKSYKPLNGGN